MAELLIKPATSRTISRASNKSKSASERKQHPSVSEMVTTAIREMNERNGSSLQAIKKFIYTNYIVDESKISTYIRKFLKAAVESGKLIQTRGKGATGSFKLGKTLKENSEGNQSNDKSIASAMKTLLGVIQNKKKQKKIALALAKLPKYKKAASTLGKKSLKK
uniref:H15 domain-containing protein n=1 Tax=Rhodnius prolixus TaxID=13249 RepID=T1HDZ9_RHOPR